MNVFEKNEKMKKMRGRTESRMSVTDGETVDDVTEEKQEKNKSLKQRRFSLQDLRKCSVLAAAAERGKTAAK